MGTPSTYEAPSYQNFEARVENDGKTWTTTSKFTATYASLNNLSQKELAIQSLEALVTKMKEEVANGDLN